MKLIEKTPKFMMCILGGCPAVFETDRDTYVVIGKKLSQEEITEFFKGRIGTGEMVIEFPKVLLEDILNRKS